jgi:hypothetical protein
VLRTLLAFFLLALTAAFAQDQFSADMFSSKNGAPAELQGKFYMTANKVRVDAEQPGRPHATVILDMATRTNIVVIPERRMYIEQPESASFQRQAYDFFRPSDVNNACVDWQQLPANRGITCRKIGNEVVNGRNTVKYEGSRPGQGTGYVWFDPALRFPIKWQGNNGSGELRNIAVAPQPASLFEVPAGYQKMNAPAAGRPPNAQPHP